MTKNQLLAITNNSIDKIYSTFQNFWQVDEATYANWLAQTYWYVSHTTRMLALASSKLPLERTHLHKEFLEHAREEAGHERLAVADLKALGYKPADFSEMPQASAIYQTMFYLIERESPLGILGYALVLEGLCAHQVSEVYPSFSERFGEKACSFLRVHCKVDVGHEQETLKILDECTPAELEIIAKGARQCGDLYLSLLQAVQSQGQISNQVTNQKTAVPQQNRRAA